MAATPFPFKQYVPESLDPVAAEHIASFIDDYESALRRSVVAAAGFDEGWYIGKLEALEDVLSALLEVPQEARDEHHSR